MTRSHTLFIVGLLATGCSDSQLIIHDSVDLTFDLMSLYEEDGGLHMPYVQGAEMSIMINHRRNGKDLQGWTATSLDPDIFQTTQGVQEVDDKGIYLNGEAISEGAATIVVYDEDGEEVERFTVDVAMPDEIELLAHGPILLNRPDLADDGVPQVLVEGTSTWLARYYRDGERLYGHGALSVGRSETFEGWAETSFLFEDRDWLQGYATIDGPVTVPLYVDEVHITDATLNAVDESVIAYMELHAEDEEDAEAEDELLVLAQAYDDAGVPVYGVEFDWQVDGVAETEAGDLFRYTYTPDDAHDLEAAINDASDSVTIHGEGYVSSTNNIGCASVPGGSSGAGLLALVAGLLGWRRSSRD